MQIDSLVVAKLDDAISMAKTMAPELWRILVTQAISEGWQAVCWGGVFILVSIFMFIKGYIWCKKDLDKKYHYIYFIIGTGILIITTIILAINVGKLINPEYYALQNLLGR